MSLSSPTWTFVGEHTNPRFRRLRMLLRRRISRRSGSSSAVWASSSSKAKPFSIISIVSPPLRSSRSGLVLVLVSNNLDVRGPTRELPLPTLADGAATTHLEAVGQQLGGLGLKLLQGQALLDHLHCLTPSRSSRSGLAISCRYLLAAIS